MHILLVIIAILLVTGGIVQNQNKQAVSEAEPDQTVLGQKNTQEDLATTLTPSPTSSPSPSPTPQPTPLPSPVSPTGAAGPSVYPGATITNESSTTIRMTSPDSPETITDWYKNTIKDLGMNTRSFVQTNTNDNIRNVLAASKSGQEIHVTITKNAGESQTTILLTR